MCLEILKESIRKPKIAKEDIEVFKVVEDYRGKRYKDDDRYGKIMTPYRGFAVVMGETYKTKFSYNLIGDVERGFHSYCDLPTAKQYLDKYGWSVSRIVRCVIPKGSRYHKGDFNGRASYASTRLKYIEFVN